MSHDVDACDVWYRSWRAGVLAKGDMPNFGLAQVAACDARKPLEEALQQILAVDWKVWTAPDAMATVQQIAHKALNQE